MATRNLTAQFRAARRAPTAADSLLAYDCRSIVTDATTGPSTTSTSNPSYVTKYEQVGKLLDMANEHSTSQNSGVVTGRGGCSCWSHPRSVWCAVRALKQAHTKRLLTQFGDLEQSMEHEVAILTDLVTDALKRAGASLRTLTAGAPRSRTPQDQHIQENMQRYRFLVVQPVMSCPALCHSRVSPPPTARAPHRKLAASLRQRSAEFRTIQQAYLTQLQVFKKHGSVQFSFAGAGVASGDAAEAPPDTGFTDSQLLELQSVEELVVERDQEIQRLCVSITELSKLFDDLSTLVVDQGTMIDRIDAQLVQAVNSTERGVLELTRADKIQSKSVSWSCRCIVLLIVLICVMVAVLVFRSQKS